jgi:hypothetical protein
MQKEKIVKDFVLFETFLSESFSFRDSLKKKGRLSLLKETSLAPIQGHISIP